MTKPMYSLQNVLGNVFVLYGMIVIVTKSMANMVGLFIFGAAYGWVAIINIDKEKK